MNHRTEAAAKLDRGRHPALFQRVTRSVPPQTERPQPRPELPTPTRTIYAAFLEFVQFDSAEIRHRDFRGRHMSPAIWDFLDAWGFYPEEIHQLKLGSYPNPEDVRSYLRSQGYSEAAIAASGLVADENHHARRDWQGCLVVPLQDEQGQIIDMLAVIPTSVPGHAVRYEFALGAVRSSTVAYGLKTALSTPLGRQNLVLVEDILEALYLQCRGFTNIAAVGGDGREFSPKRWEELARLGVSAVTLAFGNDATRQRDVREALDHALRARTAPEVFVLERTQLLENETLADVARRHGLEACRKAASAKALAFHGKDFGWSWPREAAPQNGHVPTSFHRDQYRSYLRTEFDKLPHSYERTLIQSTLAEVEDALYHRHFSQARAILEARMNHSYWPHARGEVRTQDVNMVLDRLCNDSSRSAIPEHLSRCDGNELQPGTVTILANESARGRLADMCSRLVTALETGDDRAWVVVCREFSEEAIVLGIIAQMTRRMTTAQGLTFEEIHARLSGRDPLDGYSDKPWLVDEAVDRLRHWTPRLKFLTDTTHAPHAAYAIERIAEQQTLGGVFFDALPHAWWTDKTWHSGWKSGYSSSAMMREMATRFSCAVVALTDYLAADRLTGLPADSQPAPWRTPEINRTIQEFRDKIAYWIDQEERLEVRVV